MNEFNFYKKRQVNNTLGILFLLCALIFSFNSHAANKSTDHSVYYSVDEVAGRYDGKLVPYVDLGFGLSVHVLPDADEGATSRLLKTGLGMQWLPFISTQLGLWHWSEAGKGRRNDSANSSQQQASEDEQDPPTFEGLSASLEVVLQLPLQSQNTQLSYGPYYKYGRHCWSGVLSGLVQPWSKEGCSDIQSAGFTFPSSNKRSGGLVLFLEYSQSTLEDLSSRSVQMGAKLPL